MNDHLNYFNERAARRNGAGIISDDMLLFYRSLFEYQEYFHRAYQEGALHSLAPDDLPLADKDMRFLSADDIRTLLEPGLDPIIRLVASHHPGLNVEPIRRAFSEGDTLADFTRDILRNDAERVRRFAQEHRAGVEESVFIAINWIKPCLIALREKNESILSEQESSLLCPFCGFHADMAVIVNEANGKRYLHCSLCEHQWPFKRIACAVCGSEDASKLEYCAPEEGGPYSIDTCSDCRGYIKTLRLAKGEAMGSYDLTVENILTPDLDSAALARGYRRP